MKAGRSGVARPFARVTSTGVHRQGRAADDGPRLRALRLPDSGKAGGIGAGTVLEVPSAGAASPVWWWRWRRPPRCRREAGRADPGPGIRHQSGSDRARPLIASEYCSTLRPGLGWCCRPAPVPAVNGPASGSRN